MAGSVSCFLLSLQTIWQDKLNHIFKKKTWFPQEKNLQYIYEIMQYNIIQYMTDQKLHLETQYQTTYIDMWTSFVESGASGSVWFGCRFVSCPGVSILVRVAAPASCLSF